MVDSAKSGKFNSDCNSLPSKLIQAFSKYSPGFTFSNVIQVALLFEGYGTDIEPMFDIVSKAW